MNRRDFIRVGLTALGATAVLDPERLLWVPGAKTIFIPAPITEARTMGEALGEGLLAVWPDGRKARLFVGQGQHGRHSLTFEQRVAAEVRSVEASGGRIIEHRAYVEQRLRT